MFNYVIVCRSQTEAFKVSKAISYKGITCKVLKPPREMSSTSCTFGIRISNLEKTKILELLDEIGYTPKKIYLSSLDGSVIKI